MGNYFKHSVPAARAASAPGRRVSFILWANEQEPLPRVIRAKNPGVRDIVPLEVDWELCWDTAGKGVLCRAARQRRRNHHCDPQRQKSERNSTHTESRSSIPCAPHCPTISAPSTKTQDVPPPSEDAESAVSEEDVRRLVGLLVNIATARSEVPHLRTERYRNSCTASAGERRPAQTNMISLPPQQSLYARNTCTKPGKINHSLAETGVHKSAAQHDPSVADVCEALTLQGSQQVLAILRGYKLIENRSWKIPVGWYALHAGSQVITEDRADRVKQMWPDVPAEVSLPHGAILGLFYIHSQRLPGQCRPGYIWARGPICHLISKAIEFQTPLRCSGSRGLWRLSNHQLAQIHAQLVAGSDVTYFDLTPALPSE